MQKSRLADRQFATAAATSRAAFGPEAAPSGSGSSTISSATPRRVELDAKLVVFFLLEIHRE